MTPLLMLFGALGVADLVQALPGPHARVLRLVIASLAAGAWAIFGVLASGYEWTAGLAVLAGMAAACLGALWLVAARWALDASVESVHEMSSTERFNRRAAWVLWAFALVAIVIVGTSSLWPERTDNEIRSWLEGLPYGGENKSSDDLLSVAAAILFLLESSNTVVRLVLRSVSIGSRQDDSPDDSIKGGRLIGPIERVLIFSLALAGEPTAAALIVSAKGLLRYPEIGKAAAADKGEDRPTPAVLSEYLVLGSLVSWASALSLILWMPH